MKLHLTTEERAALTAEAERRGITLPELVRLVVAKQAPRMASRLRGAKSNGWHPGREAFLFPTGFEPEPRRQIKAAPVRAIPVDQAADSDRLTEAICKLLGDQPHWRGTSTELIDRLSYLGAVAGHSVKRQLKRIRPTLSELGIVIGEIRTGTARLLILDKRVTESVTQKA